MHSRSPLWMLRALASLLLFSVPATLLNAQAYVPTPQELDQLLAPVALYPDALLAQITSASTNPQEILDVADWMHQNPGLNGLALTNAAQAQGFDPPFIALVSFPQILDMMARNIDDYAAIGAAFQANEAAVMDSVQRLREDAYESGALRSGPQQRVVVEPYNGQRLIVIQPANPQMVYVPQYDPGVVYGTGGPGAAAWITFGAGIGLGIALANSHPWGWSNWGWNWGQRRMLYNRHYWRPTIIRYRPRRTTYRPGRPNFGNRPVIRPPRPKPGGPSIQPVKPRPGQRPTTPISRPTRPGNGRPSIQPVRPGQGQQPSRPTTRPTTRPTNGVRRAPIPTRERPAQPSPKPASPNNGSNNRPNNAPRPTSQRPQTRPAQRPQNKPAPQNR